MATQPSFMNRLKQFNPFTRKNNGVTAPAQGPSFFKKNNTVKNNGSSFFNRINPFKKKNNNIVVNNLRGGRKSRKSRR